MEFFNETVANDIQFVSFFLEFTGLSLAMIEYKNPKLGDRLENYIDRVEMILAHKSQEFMKHHIYKHVIVTAFVIALFVLVYLVVYNWNQWYGIHPWIWIPMLLVTISFLVPVAMHVLVKFIDSLNKFSGGHALGSFGVCLATLGMTGEMYQIITIL